MSRVRASVSLLGSGSHGRREAALVKLRSLHSRGTPCAHVAASVTCTSLGITCIGYARYTQYLRSRS